MKMTSSAKILALLLGVALCAGCNAYMHQPMQTRDARLGEETKFTKSLRRLPPPKEKMVVAVYKFRDQTGQYKPSESGANWSTAVTQGGTNILLKALEDSGWFVPIERENVSNLLNERKIIRSSRQQFSDGKESESNLLPPLLYAGIILEGGIVSYDANLITGGFGLRYFGTGGGGQYRQDRVTVYLRVISTKSGKILKTVYTSKTVLSQAVDIGVFRFVSFQRLLEAETGITYNEPSELAVTEAIEKGVYSLVMEGLLDSLWSARDNAKKESMKAIAEYKAEKEEMRQTDVFGSKPANYRKSTALFLNYAALRYEGDYANPLLRSGYELGFNQSLNDRLTVGLTFGAGKLGTEQYFNSNFSYIDASLKYRFMTQSHFSPFAIAGGGFLINTNASPFSFQSSGYQKVFAGLGFEYLFPNSFGFQLAFDNNYLLNDKLDGMVHGKQNDYFWRTSVGLVYYIGKKQRR